VEEIRVRQTAGDSGDHKAKAPEPPRGKRAPSQPVLFSQKDVQRGEYFSAKVVSMNSFGTAPERPVRRPPANRHQHRTRIVTGQVHPPAGLPETPQQTFAFQMDAPRPSRGSAEPTRYCDAPVAPVAHRMIAAAFDLSMVLVALGLLVMLVYLSPAAEFITRKTLPYIGAFGVVLGFGYKMVWATADVDSPGTRWAHLKILNFDGVPPTRGQRLERLAGSVLSISAAGLGLIWALVDEETLSWHDHISKTFATPDLPQY
jgi:uncharacterized RDD family membrane protein YckC